MMALADSATDGITSRSVCQGVMAVSDWIVQGTDIQCGGNPVGIDDYLRSQDLLRRPHSLYGRRSSSSFSIRFAGRASD